MFKLTNGLRNQEHSYRQRYASLDNGLNPTRAPNSRYVALDRRVRHASDALISLRFSVREFLIYASHVVDNLHNEAVNVPEGDDLSDDEEALPEAGRLLEILPNAELLEVGNGGPARRRRLPAARRGRVRGAARRRGQLRNEGQAAQLHQDVGLPAVQQEENIDDDVIALEDDLGVVEGPVLPLLQINEEDAREQQVEQLRLDVVNEDAVPAAEGQETCSACLINIRNYVIMPCLHFEFCGPCVTRHRQGVRDVRGRLVNHVICPRCRGVVEHYMWVFN